MVKFPCIAAKLCERAEVKIVSFLASTPDGQLQAGKQPLATIKFETGWASKPVWTFREEIKITWPHRELNRDFSGVQLAAQPSRCTVRYRSKYLTDKTTISRHQYRRSTNLNPELSEYKAEVLLT
jgi:hypothetical protein